jgi:uncharacterized membrane protein
VGVLGKHQLNPKEDAVLKMIYHTEGRPGPYEKRIYLITDSLVQPNLEITLKGEVLPAPAAQIKIEPRKLNIGSLQKGSQKEINFKVSNQGNEPLEITKIYSATGKTLVIRKEEARTRIPRNESTELEITFQTTTIGPFVEVLLIDSNARNALKGQYAVMVIGETGP